MNKIIDKLNKIDARMAKMDKGLFRVAIKKPSNSPKAKYYGEWLKHGDDVFYLLDIARAAIKIRDALCELCSDEIRSTPCTKSIQCSVVNEFDAAMEGENHE